jgi:hypothetical protein
MGDMFGIGELGAAAIGASQRANAQNFAEQQQAEALRRWLDLNIPSVEEQKVFLEHLKSQGQLTPELEQAFQQQDSSLSSYNADPNAKEAQLNALSKLQQIGDSGGMLLEDKANLNQIAQDNAAQERGSRDAIMQNMAARGMAGSGAELAAKLAGEQGSATRAANQSMSVAAQAQKRALDAIAQSGQLGGSIRTQDLSEAEKKAAAQDAINKFNTVNRQDVVAKNVAAKNDAAKYNLNNNQRIADTNVGLTNQQELHNKDLIGKNYQDQLSKVAGSTGQYNTNANAALAAGKDAAAMWGGIGQGVGELGDSLMKKKSKDDEEEF